MMLNRLTVVCDLCFCVETPTERLVSEEKSHRRVGWRAVVGVVQVVDSGPGKDGRKKKQMLACAINQFGRRSGSPWWSSFGGSASRWDGLVVGARWRGDLRAVCQADETGSAAA
jgi:hypothetical protein